MNEQISELEKTKEDLTKQIEAAKQNEILTAIKGLNNRLTSIEEKLQEKEED